MFNSHDERQGDVVDINTNNEQISPLSNRFLIAHSSPVLETTTTTEAIIRAQDDSFQSSSSTSNSKSSSSTTSRSSRLHYLMMQQHSAVNSPLMYSRCTSLGSLASYDIRSSCNDSYTSECSSVKPSGIISPSDIPDSPPCEPEVIEEEEDEYQLQIKTNNRTLTMNTTSNNNRTTILSETVIEKTLTLNQHDSFSNRINTSNLHIHHNDDEYQDDNPTYLSDHPEWNSNHINDSAQKTELCFDDDYPRIFNSENDNNDDSLIDDQIQYDASFTVPSHENLSVITEESSFIEEMNSYDETNSIKILYDLIKKPHWTNKSTSNQQLSIRSQHLEDNTNASISSNPSSLSLDSNDGNQSGDDDDDDEYDQEKGRQLIQRLIKETLARRSVPTDYLHSTSCVLCPLNTPMTTANRSLSSSSSSISASTRSCTCITNRSSNSISQPQRSQSSPARPSSTNADDSKRQINKHKENTTVHHTRTSYLRLRQAQQNKRLHQHDKKP